MIATTIKNPQRIIRATIAGLVLAAAVITGVATAATAEASGIYGTDTVVNCAVSGPGNKDLTTPASPGNKDLTTPVSVRITANGESVGTDGCIQDRDQSALGADGVEY